MNNAICPVCRRPYEARNSRSTFCSAPCRARNGREKAKRRQELLARQTAAIVSGADEAVLASLVREARRLLGD